MYEKPAKFQYQRDLNFYMTYKKLDNFMKKYANSKSKCLLNQKDHLNK